MQNTLPLTPGNPLRNVTGLARQIALPGEHAPMRFPSFPALERTAVIGFNQPSSMSIPASATAAITLFRQPTYPLWVDTLGSHFAATQVRLMKNQDTPATANNDTKLLSAAPSLYDWTLSNRGQSAFITGFSGAPTASNLPYAILGADHTVGGSEFMYVPKSARLYISIAGSANFVGTCTVRAGLEFWDNPGQTRYFSDSTTGTIVNGFTGGLIDWGVMQSASWVRIKDASIQSAGAASTMPTFMFATMVVTSGTATFAPSATNTLGAFTITDVATNTYHLPVSAPAEFSNSQLPWYSTRLTSVAVLGTNVTQVLNKGGTILAGRLNPCVNYPWNNTTSVVSNLHPAEKAYLPLETGVYTYCPPSTDIANFYDYTLNTGGGAPPAPVFMLSNDALYNLIYVTAPPAAATLALTLSWHMEFRTTSSLFQIGMSAMTLEALHTAQLVLAETGFFFENPEHDGLLNKVIGASKKYIPQMVGVVNPSAGALLQGVVRSLAGNHKALLPKPGPTTMATTSAQKSGMNGKPKTKNTKPQPKKSKSRK